MMTLTDFISTYALTMTTERTTRNPTTPDAGTMDHWRVTLHCHKRRMTLVFSRQAGSGEPTLPNVLDAIALDAVSVTVAQTFTDWCARFGFHVASRPAERIYQACVKQSRQLHGLLGEAAYDALLWRIDRGGV